MEAWETTAEDALPGLAVYNVHDSPSPAVAPNRAQVSLPGNLALRYEDPCGAACTVVANDIVPRGTKFGPMVGDILRYAAACNFLLDISPRNGISGFLGLLMVAYRST